MDSTMQDFPLTITSHHAIRVHVHGDRTVTTATGDGYRHTHLSRSRVSRPPDLANALRRIGITGDQRVATFMWNNAEHLAAYLAIPSMGAVLHTLNIRLFARTDRLHRQRGRRPGDHRRRCRWPASSPRSCQCSRPCTPSSRSATATSTRWRESGKTVLRYDDDPGGGIAQFDWPDIDEKSAAAMCYTSGTTGNPKGVVYSHRSSYLHAMMVNSANALGVGFTDKVLPIVPMFHANAWGLPYGALMAGAEMVMPDRFLDAKSLIDLIETQRPTVAAAVPTIWNDVMHCLESDPGHDISSLRLVACGGVRGADVADEGVRGASTAFRSCRRGA